MRILTAEAMRAADRLAIEELGVPSLVLMENAAIGLADAIAAELPDATSAAIFCGPGNNGGDGLALGRHLAVRGYHVEMFRVAGGREARGDSRTQLEICSNLGLTVREIAPDEELRGAIDVAAGCDLLVDALFGVGLGRPLEGQFAELVGALNALPAPCVAVDLPSGLNGSRSDIPGPHAEAALTVTFGAPKLAHVFPPAADAVGEVVVADLGVPASLLERVGADLHLLTLEELAGELVPRPPDSHKGDYGHVLLVAGSLGKTGAAILAARGAVRGGAGLVTVATPREVVATVDLGCVEAMTHPLPQGDTGGLAAEAAETVLELADGKQVLALGPGLGRDPGTVEVVRRIVRACALPVVADADAVNALAGSGELLRGRAAPTLLTPHPGELGRLLGISAARIQADRLAAARRAVEETGAIVALKGRRTLVAAPGGEVHVNPTGNAGMASGGAGDVLTGLVASLVAQGQEPLAAARLAVFLHGLAGDLAAETQGLPALAANDLVEALPRAFAALAGA